MGQNEKLNVLRETLRRLVITLLFISFCTIGLATFSSCSKPDANSETGVPTLPTESTSTTAPKPAPFRQEAFSLQKRHGLGGWSGPKRPSEQELLLRMKPKTQLSKNIQASSDKSSTEASLKQGKAQTKPHKASAEKQIKTH